MRRAAASSLSSSGIRQWRIDVAIKVVDGVAGELALVGTALRRPPGGPGLAR
jgi:hypothetical protein